MAIPGGVKTAFEEYCKVAKQAGVRQQIWKSTTKDLIIRILTEVKNGLMGFHLSNSPLIVSMDEEDKNWERVSISFADNPTAIVKRVERGMMGLSKMGGALSYSQVPDGKVHVGISFPYIEKLQEKKKTMTLALLNPEEITEERIYQHIEHFFREIKSHEDVPSEEHLAPAPKSSVPGT